MMASFSDRLLSLRFNPSDMLHGFLLNGLHSMLGLAEHLRCLGFNNLCMSNGGSGYIGIYTYIQF